MKFDKIVGIDKEILLAIQQKAKEHREDSEDMSICELRMATIAFIHNAKGWIESGHRQFPLMIVKKGDEMEAYDMSEAFQQVGESMHVADLTLAEFIKDKDPDYFVFMAESSATMNKVDKSTKDPREGAITHDVVTTRAESRDGWIIRSLTLIVSSPFDPDKRALSIQTSPPGSISNRITGDSNGVKFSDEGAFISFYDTDIGISRLRSGLH